MPRSKNSKLNPFYKNLALWLVITLMMIMLYNLFNQQHTTSSSASYSDFLAMVDSGKIEKVVIRDQELNATDTSGRHFQVYAPQDADLISILRRQGVQIQAEPPTQTPWYVTILVSWFPILVLIGVWIFFMRQIN